MRLTCSMGNHEAAPDPVRNQGLEFTHCVNCGRDMVRSGREWRRVPRGFRVVWRRSAPRHAERAAARFLVEMPASGKAVALPADRKRAAGPTAQAAELILLAMTYLVSTAAERLKTWLKAKKSPAPPRTAVLALTAR